MARSGFCSLGLTALGAWAGIVSFVGPAFGFRADGTASWDLSLNHVLLYLAPGALAFLAGVMLARSSWAARRDSGRASGLLAGVSAVVAGLWLVIGPAAWPMIDRAVGAGPFVVVPTTALGNLVNQVGYNLGVGALIIALGAMACSLALRRRTQWAEPAALTQPVALTPPVALTEPSGPRAMDQPTMASPTMDRPTMVRPTAVGEPAREAGESP